MCLASSLVLSVRICNVYLASTIVFSLCVPLDAHSVSAFTYSASTFVLSCLSLCLWVFSYYVVFVLRMSMKDFGYVQIHIMPLSLRHMGWHFPHMSAQTCMSMVFG
jgi:hypothetical protein